jgi:hypothetical protein
LLLAIVESCPVAFVLVGWLCCMLLVAFGFAGAVL